MHLRRVVARMGWDGGAAGGDLVIALSVRLQINTSEMTNLDSIPRSFSYQSGSAVAESVCPVSSPSLHPTSWASSPGVYGNAFVVPTLEHTSP